MNEVNIKRQVSGNIEAVIGKVTEALKNQGFGILSRIDFDQKMKEKLGKTLPPTVILGACNPALAFEAYSANSDVTSLLPCNAVVRDIGNSMCSVELALPSAMMKMLGDARLAEAAREADKKLSQALNSL